MNENVKSRERNGTDKGYHTTEIKVENLDFIHTVRAREFRVFRIAVIVVACLCVQCVYCFCCLLLLLLLAGRLLRQPV